MLAAQGAELLIVARDGDRSSLGPKSLAPADLPVRWCQRDVTGICLPLHPAPSYRRSVYGQARHEDGPRGVTVLSSP